ncbi:MAG: hypothetical protein AB1349_08285 [Elusimicrobiota bacterium]
MYKTFGKSRCVRLKDVDYTNILYPLHIIIGTFNRKPIFSYINYAEVVFKEISNVASQFNWDEIIVSYKKRNCKELVRLSIFMVKILYSSHIKWDATKNEKN